MNIEDKDKDTETQSEFDVEAATAEISDSLFGQGGEAESAETSTEGAGEKVSSESEATVETSSSPQSGKEGETGAETQQTGEEGAAAQEDNSEAVQAAGAPKTWTKEALAKWSTIDPVVQAEITKREGDFLKGIGMYKEAAELGSRYDKVVEPYKPILAAENVDPVGLFQSFAANHYLLSRGTSEQKLQVCANLVKGYGIDLNALITHIGEDAVAPADPEVAALRQEIDALKQGIDAQRSDAMTVAQTRIQQEVDAFAADTAAHPYFNEVINDMMALMKAGSAQSLQEAYEKAVFANPETRQKEIERLTAEKLSTAAAEEQTRKDKIASSTADHVKVDPHNRNGTVPVGTMDETLEATMREITSRV
jgi:hypothetical protein